MIWMNRAKGRQQLLLLCFVTSDNQDVLKYMCDDSLLFSVVANRRLLDQEAEVQRGGKIFIIKEWVAIRIESQIGEDANYSMLITIVSISNFVSKKSNNYDMEKEPILLHFGKQVQQLRKDRNLSQEQLAELAGVHRTYIGMIERAEKNITLYNIERIAKALEVNIKDLF